MNTTLEEVNSRTTEAEEWIRDLEDRMVEITAAKQNIRGKIKKKKKKKKDSVRNFWDNIKCTKGSHKEKREREKGLKKIFEEIIAENFPNMG